METVNLTPGHVAIEYRGKCLDKMTKKELRDCIDYLYKENLRMLRKAYDSAPLEFM